MKINTVTVTQYTVTIDHETLTESYSTIMPHTLLGVTHINIQYVY